MKKLEEWFMTKNGKSSGTSGSAPPPPPPGPPSAPPAPAAAERPGSANNPNGWRTKSGRQSLLSDLSKTPELKKVVAPEQKLILPEAIGSEEKSRYTQKDTSDSDSD